jgi:hypothetical protein
MQMYRPIQLNNGILYQEKVPDKSLSGKIAYYWQINTGSEAVDYAIIPDGCVDIVIECDTRQAYFIPTTITPDVVRLKEHGTWFGTRFLPAVIPGVLNVNLAELGYQSVDLAAVNQRWHRALSDMVAGMPSFDERIKAASRFLNQTFTLDSRQDYQLSLALQQIYSKSEVTTGRNEATARRLRRLFHRHIGTSPKKFAMIVRSQAFLRTLQHKQSTRSFYGSYYDQSHMVKELKAMTGHTPSQLAALLNDVRFLQS